MTYSYRVHVVVVLGLIASLLLYVANCTMKTIVLQLVRMCVCGLVVSVTKYVAVFFLIKTLTVFSFLRSVRRIDDYLLQRGVQSFGRRRSTLPWSTKYRRMQEFMCVARQMLGNSIFWTTTSCRTTSDASGRRHVDLPITSYYGPTCPTRLYHQRNQMSLALWRIWSHFLSWSKWYTRPKSMCKGRKWKRKSNATCGNECHFRSNELTTVVALADGIDGVMHCWSHRSFRRHSKPTHSTYRSGCLSSAVDICARLAVVVFVRTYVRYIIPINQSKSSVLDRTFCTVLTKFVKTYCTYWLTEWTRWTTIIFFLMAVLRI